MPGSFDVPDFTEDFIARELTAIHDTVILNDVAKRFDQDVLAATTSL